MKVCFIFFSLVITVGSYSIFVSASPLNTKAKIQVPNWDFKGHASKAKNPIIDLLRITLRNKHEHPEIPQYLYHGNAGSQLVISFEVEMEHFYDDIIPKICAKDPRKKLDCIMEEYEQELMGKLSLVEGTPVSDFHEDYTLHEYSDDFLTFTQVGHFIENGQKYFFIERAFVEIADPKDKAIYFFIYNKDKKDLAKDYDNTKWYTFQYYHNFQHVAAAEERSHIERIREEEEQSRPLTWYEQLILYITGVK